MKELQINYLIPLDKFLLMKEQLKFNKNNLPDKECYLKYTRIGCSYNMGRDSLIGLEIINKYVADNIIFIVGNKN
jgi:hypothetical protein